MFLLKTRQERESVIVQAMIKMYCHENHKSGGALCKECSTLSAYAEKRLLSCMYGNIKPVCKHCPVHCYSPGMREQMRLVMSWAGPRMIFRNPLFAILHIIDNIKTTNRVMKKKYKSKREK